MMIGGGGGSGGGRFEGASSLFSGSGFMPSQATQPSDPAASPSKSRGGSQGSLPLTVKQIREALYSSDDKCGLVVDGIDATSVELLGFVMNKTERVTDISFTLDDSTGRIEISRWTNEPWDSNELAMIQNGMYVKVNASLKGFQGKQRATAFSVRPVTDFNNIALHFLECIYVHIYHTRQKGGTPSQFQRNLVMITPFPNAPTGYQVHPQHPAQLSRGMNGYGNDIYNLVLGVFQETASLAREHGLHIDEIVQRLGLPRPKIMEAINYHVDVGHIYSTIDDNYFKSACNGSCEPVYSRSNFLVDAFQELKK